MIFSKLIKVTLTQFSRPRWQKKIDRFRVKEQKKRINKPSLRILVGPSFSLWEPCRALDRVISLGLEIRGCEIIPVYCDSMQEPECNCVGGNWGGGTGWVKNCKKCRQASEQMWLPYGKNLVKLSQYVEIEDKKKINDLLSPLSFDEMCSFSYENVDYGRLGKDILVNNYLVASPKLVPNGATLLRTHIKNLIQLTCCYRRLLQDLKPDRVISNDSYYGMWRVLEYLCKELQIPYYSHWPVTKDRIAVAANDAAMNLNLRESWKSFSKHDLKVSEVNKIQNWLAGNRGLVIDTTKPYRAAKKPILRENINDEKPTILLAANVVWDLAALNKQIVFKDMNQWILETVKWFETRPDYQLIIKPHPIESAPEIPKTNETVAEIINSEFQHLPGNVMLLRSDTDITSNELLNLKNLKGVVVHTTTVGFEFPARGCPTITTAMSPYRGFGFTVDPSDRDEYFLSLQKLLESQTVQIDPEAKELALKFIKFYQFHYYSKISAFEGNPVHLSGDFERIIRAEDGGLNYILNQIISGNAINESDKWLPET